MSKSGRLDVSPTPVERIAPTCPSIRAQRLTLRVLFLNSPVTIAGTFGDRLGPITRLSQYEVHQRRANRFMSIIAKNISGNAVCQAVALHYLYAGQRKGLRAALWVHATKWLRLG